MKKIIILNHNGGQLANQLWNHVSIYAYSLERSIPFENYCFFEYAEHFNIPINNIFINIIFYKSFKLFKKILPLSIQKKIWRKVYFHYSNWVKKTYSKQIIYSRTTKTSLGTYFLPPSVSPTQEIELLEKQNGAIFFDGWLFRNPQGILNWRNNIIKQLKPHKKIEKNIRLIMRPCREEFKKVIGVHIRQGDYREFKHGRFFINQKRVREIIDEYIKHHDIDPQTTCFILCSDGNIEYQYFEGLNILTTNKNLVEDLFILASCDVILGSDSTFGAFASYYGNIPHIIFQKDSMDWEYYAGKKEYFENKYCLSVCNDPTLWSGT